uniref:Uncharacterized protein n=1 Tax=Oryza glumipatula TaxID=40148 RepID=A0A0D9ZDH9_9ORYZ
MVAARRGGEKEAVGRGGRRAASGEGERDSDAALSMEADAIFGRVIPLYHYYIILPHINAVRLCTRSVGKAREEEEEEDEWKRAEGRGEESTE